MLSAQTGVTTKTSRIFEKVTLWIVVGLLLTLSIAWNVYPRIYYRYHVAPRPWPGEESFGISNSALCFWYACFLQLLGYLQLRFSRPSRRGPSEVFFWLFLLFGFGGVLGAWMFSLAIHFWTLTDKMLFLQAEQTMKIGRTFAVYGLRFAVGVGLLNLGVSIVRKHSSSSTPGFRGIYY